MGVLRFLKVFFVVSEPWLEFLKSLIFWLIISIIIHSYLSLSPQLRNGPDGSSPLLGGRLCGSSPPSVLQTTDNHLFIHFVSDASNEASGFKLVFEAHNQGRIFTSSLSQEMFQCRKAIISKHLVMVDKFRNRSCAVETWTRCQQNSNLGTTFSVLCLGEAKGTKLA